MKKIPQVLFRFRLITSFLAFVLLLGTLVVTPARADDPFVIEGQGCENGCIGWNQQSGCVTCQRCCVEPNGDWSCWLVASNECP